jgi:acyl-CoA thioesterase-2
MFSARRVVAVQQGEVIFNMSASFHRVEDGPDRRADPVPTAGDPAALPPFILPRLSSMEARLPTQPFAGTEWPTRFWARCTDTLPDDPLLHACVLTYLSDISTGLSPWHDEQCPAGPSLDHAVWFHRPVRSDDWMLLDLVPRTIAAGRGWYIGTVHARAGALAASLTQETLFRQTRR